MCGERREVLAPEPCGFGVVRQRRGWEEPASGLEEERSVSFVPLAVVKRVMESRLEETRRSGHETLLIGLCRRGLRDVTECPFTATGT